MNNQEFEQIVKAQFTQSNLTFTDFKARTEIEESITYHPEWGWLYLDEMGFSGRGGTLADAVENCRRTTTDHREWITDLLSRLQPQ